MFPVGPSVPNVLNIQIYAALNNKYAKLGLTVANKYAKLSQEAIDLDNVLFDKYNEDMPGVVENGKKWSGMISCGQNYHIGLHIVLLLDSLLSYVVEVFHTTLLLLYKLI